MSSNPNTHTGATKVCDSNPRVSDTFFWDLKHCTHMVHTQAYRQNTHTNCTEFCTYLKERNQDVEPVSSLKHSNVPNKYRSYMFMYMGVLLAYTSVHHSHAWYTWSSKKASDPLELKVVSWHVSTGNWTWFLWKNSKKSYSHIYTY